MDKDTRAFFESRYEDPVIETAMDKDRNVFHALDFFGVYEKRNLAEDPLVPDIWIRTPSGGFYRNHDIETALEESGIAPRDEKEARSFARELVRIKYRSCQPLAVPAPSVRKTETGCIASVQAYYPDGRYARHFSFHVDAYVDYVGTMERGAYTVTETRALQKGEETTRRLEENLVAAVIEALQDGNLFAGLAPYLEKKSLYGLSDPSDVETVRNRVDELAELWAKGFSRPHPALESLARQVLSRNPDYRFDADAVYEATKDLAATRTVERYRKNLSILLQDIVAKAGG